MRGSVPLTEDGCATLDPEDVETINQLGVHMPSRDEGSGYDVIEDEDLVKDHYKMNEEFNLVRSSERRSDDEDHDEPYFEPADREEELMAQLSKLNLPVISSERVE